VVHRQFAALGDPTRLEEEGYDRYLNVNA